MLHRIVNGLLLAILDFTVRQSLFQWDAFLSTVFKLSEHLLLTHLVDEGVVFVIRPDNEGGLVRHLI